MRTAIINGDYSKFPESIRKEFQFLEEEVMGLRELWEVYSHLFMENKKLTEAMSENLGGMLAYFQSMLENELYLCISKLTDKSNNTKVNVKSKNTKDKVNLSLWWLLEITDNILNTDLKEPLDYIDGEVKKLREHRNKRIAHPDHSFSLNPLKLPLVTFNKIRELVEKIEDFLNHFNELYRGSTILYESIQSHGITDPAETTVFKARAYDLLVAEGVISKLEFKRISVEIYS